MLNKVFFNFHNTENTQSKQSKTYCTFISERQLFSVKNCVMFFRHFSSSMESMLFSEMFNTHKHFCEEKKKRKI